jgi:predicted MFS family arabinose efflux permease
MKTIKKLTPWLIWIVPVTFCAFQFVLRLFPGHVQNQLMNDFTVSAEAFGTFSASYYLGYAGFQIPVAILLEKLKTKKMIATSAFACALGCMLFAFTNHWSIALLSRFIVGAGSATGLLGTTKVVLDWFPVKHHAKMIGISMSVGLLGAIYGGQPMGLLIEIFDWRSVVMILGILASFIALMALFLIKDTSTNECLNVKSEKASWSKATRSLLRNKMFIVLIIANFSLVGCLEGFADVWGIQFLSIAATISVVDASLLTSFIFVGMLLGMPLLSAIADRTNSHMKITAFCGICMTVLFSILLFHTQIFSVFALKSLLLCIGVLSGYQTLVFVIGEQLVPKVLSNTAIALLNCSNMLGGAFFHKAIGLLIDSSAKIGINSVHPTLSCYSLEQYSIGLTIIPIMSLMGGLLLLWYRKFPTSFRGATL